MQRMARPVVIKLGSSTLVDARGRLRKSRLDRIADELGAITADTPICIVSSGAIALGLGHLGRMDRPGTVAELQAAAAVGQALLQQAWQRALGRSGRGTGQVLLAASDFERRESYLNARHTLETLLGWGVTPIVNENDSTATQEITFGDNDALAAQVAVLLGARLLVLLTDQEGLYTRDPKHPDAALVREVPDASVLDDVDTAAGGSS
jgi:glutamate 5-kinase